MKIRGLAILFLVVTFKIFGADAPSQKATDAILDKKVTAFLSNYKLARAIEHLAEETGEDIHCVSSQSAGDLLVKSLDCDGMKLRDAISKLCGQMGCEFKVNSNGEVQIAIKGEFARIEKKQAKFIPWVDKSDPQQGSLGFSDK